MQPHDPASSTPTKQHGWLLPGIVVLAAVLRAWSLDFGIPHTLARPDETEIVLRAVRLLTGDLNPHFFHYPSLYFYLIGSVFAVFAGGLAVLGQPLADTLAQAAVDPSPYLLMARGVTAIAGVSAVAAVYALGRTFGGRSAGLCAAFFLAVAPLHVRDSHFATTDVVLTLFLTLSTLFVLRAYRDGRWHDYAMAGALAGLAVSTKYVGLLMPGAITVAYLLRFADTHERPALLTLVQTLRRDPLPWIFTGAMLCSFVVTTPYSVLDWPLFSSHFGFQLGHLSDGHGLDLGIGGWYHLRYTLPLGVGWPVFLVALGGIALAISERWREAVVLLAFPLLFYASTFTSRTLFLRYMLPLIPFLCVFAGYGLSRSIERWAEGRAALLTLATAVLVIGPLYQDVTTNRLLGMTDSRVLAGAWLEGEAAGVTTIFQTGEHYGHLELPGTVEELEARVSRPLPAVFDPKMRPALEYDVFRARARLAAARERDVGFRTVQLSALAGGLRPDYLVTLQSGLIRYRVIPPELARVVAEEYEPVHHVPGVPADGSGWYDQHDAFFLPFVGFEGVVRPGPTVTIYRRAADSSPSAAHRATSTPTP